MDLRNTPGEILDRVSKESKSFIVERKGEMLACIIPITLFLPNIKNEILNYELEELHVNKEYPKIRLTNDNQMEMYFLSGETKGDIELRIILPHGYPNVAPQVFTNPALPDNVPHKWKDGSLCIFGAYTNWNPGKNNIYTTLKFARQWLSRYDIWKKTGTWKEEKNV